VRLIHTYLDTDPVEDTDATRKSYVDARAEAALAYTDTKFAENKIGVWRRDHAANAIGPVVLVAIGSPGTLIATHTVTLYENSYVVVRAKGFITTALAAKCRGSLEVFLNGVQKDLSHSICNATVPSDQSTLTCLIDLGSLTGSTGGTNHVIALRGYGNYANEVLVYFWSWQIDVCRAA
jgi:hypothetical protein